MKKPIHLTIAFLTLILLVSCGNQKEENPKNSQAEKTEEQQHIEDNNLILNNGELWIANKETTQGIDNMIVLMNSFSDKESVEAYAKLKTNLDKEFGTILKECTMKGESHDQLHNFLIPMQAIFEGLGSNDLRVCKENYNILNDHLKEYSKYFK